MVILDSVVEGALAMPDRAEADAFIAGVVRYLATGEEPELTGYALALFIATKPAIDTSKSRSESGRAGGRAKAEKQNGKQTPSEQEQEQEEELKDKKEREKKKFSPPSVEEVWAYCVEKRLSVDAKSFVDFYESKGWKVGSSPMKDWKAACRTWANRENKRRSMDGTLAGIGTSGGVRDEYSDL